MNTILLINETFLLLPNQSLSIEYKQFSCVSNMKVWLIIHFIISRLVEYMLVLPFIMILSYIVILFFYDYWEHISDFIEGNWPDIWNLDRYSLIMIVMKKELRLILIYVYIVFLYTWLQLVNSNHRVTYFNFLRWFAEGSFLPQILFFTLIYYFLCVESFFEMYHLLYVPMIVTKIPLFVLMRYAEFQSDFFLNKWQISLFDTYCYQLRKSIIYWKKIE